VRQGAPRGDIHDGESGGVPGLHARALRFDHLAVRFSATVVFVHRRRQAEPAREKARRGVDADDRVFGGADGPVRLDAHVALDGDSLLRDEGLLRARELGAD